MHLPLRAFASRKLALALGGAWLAASLAFAFPGEPRHGFEPSPEQLIARHAAELGIDAATQEKIRALGEQHRAEREVIVTALREQKRALRTLLESERPSESEAIALARKIGTLETDLSVARISAMMRMHALLTPEQNAALHEKMRSRFVERRALFDAAVKACDEEIAEHCADADGPPGHALMCLVHKQRTEQIAVSSACETALHDLPPPHIRHFRHRLPPPSGEGAGEPFDVLVPPPPGADLEEGE
jgi:Spy/CpxP family protein refolding chaperone